MNYNRLIKNAICIGVSTSFLLSSTSSFAMVTPLNPGQRLTELSMLIDGPNVWRRDIMEPVSEAAISITGSAIIADEVTPSAIKVEPKKEEKSKFENKAISKAKDYVCVRSKNTTNSRIVGKLYRGSIATITKTKGSWVKVKSGSVSGYIKKEYLAIGDAAEKMSEKYVIKKAKVQTETLMVREKKSTKSRILDLVGEDDSLKVVKEGEEWTKIKISGETGYVASAYIDVVDTYEKASKVESVSTVARRSSSNAVSAGSSSSRSISSRGGSSRGTEIANYALSFLGNPYVYGGTSLTNGTDCSGFTQSVLRKFGISVPRTSRAQSSVGRSISPSQAQAGDLIFYARNGSINHVALCIGGGRVVHASNPSTGIRTSNIYYRTPVAVRRVL